MVPPIPAVLLILLIAFAGPASAYETERVVLVIIDGLRYAEGLGHPTHRYTPRMGELADQGVIIEPFLNDGITYTYRAIPAIWCGAWTEVIEFNDPDCNFDLNNHSELPTGFEYFRKQLDKDEDDCIYILEDVGCPWRGSFNPDYGPDYWPRYFSQGEEDLDGGQHRRHDLGSCAEPSRLYEQDDDARDERPWPSYMGLENPRRRLRRLPDDTAARHRTGHPAGVRIQYAAEHS